MTNALDTTQSGLLQQQSTTICNKQVEELPVMWSIIGYVAVGLTKIILSIISIGVNKLDLSAHTVEYVTDQTWPSQFIYGARDQRPSFIDR